MFFSYLIGSLLDSIDCEFISCIPSPAFKFTMKFAFPLALALALMGTVPALASVVSREITFVC
jgi:hypothetical protein